MNNKKPLLFSKRVLNRDSMKIDDDSIIAEFPNSSAVLSRKLSVGMKNVKMNHILKDLMSKQKVNLKALSRATGIPLSTLGSYTAGKKAAYNPDHLAKLCEHFQISADYLLFGSNSTVDSLNSLLTEEVFNGYLKVSIERVIPTNKKGKD